MSSRDYDVLIVGGGIAGLACAALLRNFPGATRAPLRIGILETRAPQAIQASDDTGLRVFAIAPASRAVLSACGAWQMLPANRVFPYQRMRVWQADGTAYGPGSIGFDAADSGWSELGHIVEHDWLRQCLWNGLAASSPGAGRPVAMIGHGTAVELQQESDAMVVRLDNGDVLRTRLLVGADGVHSWVREQLHLNTSARAYGQTALVAHVSSEKAHEATAWQCFTRSGPVALLPLADGRSSIVWSCFDAEARELAGLGPDEFEARLTSATGAILGRLRLTTPRLAFPLAAQHTHRYTGARFALIGDAAHQIHPLAGQGINLGLLDAATLAETLALHVRDTWLADPGDALVLRRYERRRKGANLMTMATMEGLHRVFTSDSSALTQLAAAGLGMVDRLALIKRFIAAGASGPDVASAWERHESL